MLNTRIHTRIGRLGHNLHAAIEKVGSVLPAIPYLPDGDYDSGWWLMNQAERDPDLAAILQREGILPQPRYGSDEVEAMRS